MNPQYQLQHPLFSKPDTFGSENVNYNSNEIPPNDNSPQFNHPQSLNPNTNPNDQIDNNNNNNNIMIYLNNQNEPQDQYQEPDINTSNYEKIQELMESKKIINTLRSIKVSSSVNYDDIKLLPSLFLDMQEALKKSNANVLELKETIKDKIQTEKKLRMRLKENDTQIKSLTEAIYKLKSKNNECKLAIEKLKLENTNLNQNSEYVSTLKRKYEEVLTDNKSLKRKIENLQIQTDATNEENENLKQLKTELENKNKNYKYKKAELENKLTNIQECLDEMKNMKQQIKHLMNTSSKMKDTINTLENEKKQLKEDNIKHMTIIKSMKTELKNHLTEKISLVKSIEAFKNDLSHYEELKKKYTELYEDFGNILKENKELRIEIQEKKFTDNDLNKLTEKYETELYTNKTLLNIWKRNFLEIAKFKLINYDNQDNNSSTIEQFIQIDNNYISNAPNDIKETSSKVINYFKNLIEQENYKTVNLRQLKELLSQEQERNSYMKDKLQKEVLLRRKIHNRYMYIRGNLRVMCRIRPFLPSEIINKKSQMETFYISNDTISIKEINKNTLKTFEFDYIFDHKSSQNEVYEEATLLIQSMLQGNNVCIIAYGQTCTGKTYTIQGPDLHNNAGIAIKAAKEIFEMLNTVSQLYTSTRLTLTIIEIYNEQIYNLLDDTTPSLNMYENASGNLIIPDLTPITISSFTEVVKLFKLASKFRHTSTTEYNDRSSRSHCVFTFKLKMVRTDGEIVRSTLNIIDLAGSERISKSKNEDELIKKEAICINLSLHALSSVLNAISTKASHVPYRDSKLTHFLKESLGEDFNILLMLHISPHVRDLGETISTLQFGTRIVKICKHKTGRDKINLIANTYIGNDVKNE